MQGESAQTIKKNYNLLNTTLQKAGFREPPKPQPQTYEQFLLDQTNPQPLPKGITENGPRLKQTKIPRTTIPTQRGLRFHTTVRINGGNAPEQRSRRLNLRSFNASRQ